MLRLGLQFVLLVFVVCSYCGKTWCHYEAIHAAVKVEWEITNQIFHTQAGIECWRKGSNCKQPRSFMLLWQKLQKNEGSTTSLKNLDIIFASYVQKQLEITVCWTHSNGFLTLGKFGLSLYPSSITFSQCQTVPCNALKYSLNEAIQHHWK